MPRHPPIALKTLDRSHCQYSPAQFQRNCRFSLPLTRLASAQSEGLSPKPNPVRDRNLMILAQKDQLLEIGSRARLGKPIICGRLSVSRDKSRTFRLMKFEQIFSLQCQTEQAESQEAHHKLLFTNDFYRCLISTRHLTSDNPDGLREWWSRTGSNRRHPACKAGALPAELRPLIVSSLIR